MAASDSLPNNIETLKAALIETRAKLVGAEALIEHLQLVIAKMKRQMFGPRSERSQRLIEQMELELEELAAAAGEDEAKTAPASVAVEGFTRLEAHRHRMLARQIDDLLKTRATRSTSDQQAVERTSGT